MIHPELQRHLVPVDLWLADEMDVWEIGDHSLRLDGEANGGLGVFRPLLSIARPQRLDDVVDHAIDLLLPAWFPTRFATGNTRR